ncbi:MAG: protein-disulfide reductase DsbD [Chromatiales bacterium]|nr:protein-disulfide reductase DsbD [Chromatiales bacterium]
MKTLLLSLLLLLPGWVAAQSDADLLEPDKAFQVTSRLEGGDRVEVTYRIADGYYLYRDKLKIRSTTDEAGFGKPELPKGKIKSDEFFGDVEILRGTVVATFPITRGGSGAVDLKYEAGFQGCADMGICYPPQLHKGSVQLTALSEPASETKSKPAALESLTGLGKSLGLMDANDDVLPPEEAFKLIVDVQDPTTLRAVWQIADGHYLYRDKFKFALRNHDGVVPEAVAIAETVLPPGEEKNDEFFGLIQVFHHSVEATIRLARSDAAARTITLESSYQGCAEAGICYPPIKEYTELKLPAVPAGQTLSAPAATAAANPGTAPAAPISEQDRLAASLASGSGWLTVLSFFGFGLLLAFTPCVFPMIPILSSIIVGQGRNITTRRAFTLSLIYVLAMAVTYTIAGVVAGLFGSNLQAAFQNPWILSSFAAIFALLSLSMFGFYELQMPNAIQSRLTMLSNKQEGGGFAGVAVMGLLSALIVGPCVAPPLMGALIYIGQTGDAFLGGAALFALSMGMGLPLLAIGTSAGKFLPRAGGWMDTVKAVFGVLMLAVAVWMLERILPGQVTLALWALLLIVPAIYMGALEPLKVESTGWQKLWKGLGLVMLVYGTVLIVGASSGSTDAFQPLRLLANGGGHGGGAAAAQHELPFKRIKSVDDLDREIAAASQRGMPAMLDFYADWCVSCKEMEKYTFSDPEVQQALANTVLLQADVTANDEQDQALLKRFGLFGPPSILFYGADGQERKGYRLVGYLEAEKFRAHAEQAIR